MKKLSARFFVNVFAIVETAFATIQVGGSALIFGGVNCCTYGIDCQPVSTPDQELKCCYPDGGQAPCSYQNPNYCKPDC